MKIKKDFIYIGVIIILVVFLAITLGLSIFFIINGKQETNYNQELNWDRNFNWSFDNNSSTAEETVIVDKNVQLEEKTVDSVDYSNYTGKVDLDSLSITGTGIDISDKTITITSAGIFYFTGKSDDCNVVVNAGDNDKVILVFENVNITSSTTSVINGINAKKITVNLMKDSNNTFTDSSNYTVFTEDDEPNATIFSKTDLIISGEGSLTINSNYKDAIASKDDLIIGNATIKINSVDDGIRGKDCVQISNANITINSKGDAIKSTNDSDSEKGYVLINNSNITIETEADGIQAETILKIVSGNITIKTTGSTENDNSSKALKAGTLIQIKGGSFDINTTDDGLHSNGNIYIDNGNFNITSKDDAIHADGLIEINGGAFNLTAAEGIEATYVKINDGTINISASDDGINAGKKSTSYEVTVEINGGYITIKMGSGDTDGIDSNGNLYINGGTIDVTGNSPFDYDGTAEYNGGTLIVNGEQTNTITNQFMGGGPGGNMPGGNMPENMPENMPGGVSGGMQPNQNNKKR